MINHITAKLSLSIIILITRASIAQRLDDFSSDDNIFLSDQQASLDPSLDLFTTNDPIVASVPQACHAECDTENLFSNDIPARVKPRQQPNQDDHDDACLPPLPPNILNIYDSKQILNILSGDGTTLSPTGTGISGTDSSPDDTPAAAAGDDEKKDSIIDFPGILDPNLGTTSTSDQEQRRSKCPGLWDMATTPVCSSMNFRRDNLRYPKDYHWTLFNARYWFAIAPCVIPEKLYCCVRVNLEPHPLDPWPLYPSVNTGFVCYPLGSDGRLEFSRPDPAIDAGDPLYRDDGTPVFPPPITGFD